MVDSDGNCDVIEIPETWRPKIFILSIALVLLSVLSVVFFHGYANTQIDRWIILVGPGFIGVGLFKIALIKPQ